MIPFVNLPAQRKAYQLELENAEKQVLDSGCYIGGPVVRQLEGELSRFLGSEGIGPENAPEGIGPEKAPEAPECISCASGTDALSLALEALEVKLGDEVIVPDFTFIAPAECARRLGATVRFADINPETLQISAESVWNLVGPRTKGVIAVDLFGQCAPYRELREICQKNGLWLLEDCAQAFGATQDGRAACTFGDIAITSFYPTKPLGCYGDGGALFTRNEKFATTIRELANHGSTERYLHKRLGYNSRLDALQAAILLVKLKHFKDELRVREKNATLYDQFFKDFARKVGYTIQPIKIAAGNTSTYAQYTLLVENREHFLGLLEKAEIPYCIHYPMPLHQQPCFADKLTKCPITEDVVKKVVSLPVCAWTDVEGIINKLS
ncbi:MAG: DegT/DnrJ/EryC1/StrS family aminotransferase [Fibrobacter sp.]|nr:DegT/DnrJ/EryC1/StrS family aminotransferase [Fibrobacter sp.]